MRGTHWLAVGLGATLALAGCTDLPTAQADAPLLLEAVYASQHGRPTLPPEQRPDEFIDFILHLMDDGSPNNCVIIGARSGEEIDMSGVVVGANGLHFRLPEGTIIPAGGRLVVHWNASGPTTPSDVWTGPGLGDFSLIEGEVILVRPKGGRHVPTPPRVIDYLKWDTDDVFGNDGALFDPHNERAARAAGLWDGSFADVAGADFLMEVLALLNPADGPGVTGSDYGLRPR